MNKSPLDNDMFKQFAAVLENPKALEDMLKNIPEHLRGAFNSVFGTEGTILTGEPPAPKVTPSSLPTKIVVYTDEYVDAVLNGDADIPVGFTEHVEAAVITQFVNTAFSGISNKRYFANRIDNLFEFALTIYDDNFDHFVKTVAKHLQNEKVWTLLSQSVAFDKFCHLSSKNSYKKQLLAQSLPSF